MFAQDELIAWYHRLTKLPVLVVASILGGACVTQASLIILSEPESAFITGKETGESYGAAPVKLSYDPVILLQNANLAGCYLIAGFEARWISGAVTLLETVRLCGSQTGSFKITINRDPMQSGLDKDMQFAMELKTMRDQQRKSQGGG